MEQGDLPRIRRLEVQAIWHSLTDAKYCREPKREIKVWAIILACFGAQRNRSNGLEKQAVPIRKR